VNTSVDELTGLVRHQAVEAAVRRVAPGLGADADQLMDSRAFAATTRDLDPHAPDFASQVVAAVQQAAEADPRFRAASAPAAARQPAVLEGERQWTDEDVERSSPAELQAAIDNGLLADLTVGNKPRRRRGGR
jgi:hypothetical protein